jgi:hypothetical protein
MPEINERGDGKPMIPSPGAPRLGVRVQNLKSSML